MFKKFNKTQIIIFISIIICIILLIFGIVFCINKFNNDDVKDTGIKIVEETNTEEPEISTTNNIEIKNEEAIEENNTTSISEIETATTESITEVQTQAPTQPQTEAPKPTEAQTQAPSQAVTQPQYYDPYTGQPISKEEYDRIWNEINNPKPTEPQTEAPKENVYVLNDDGTINFKESTIIDIDDENLNNYILNSHEVHNIFGNDYYSITSITTNLTSFGYLYVFFSINNQNTRGFLIENGNFIELNEIQ